MTVYHAFCHYSQGKVLLLSTQEGQVGLEVATLKNGAGYELVEPFVPLPIQPKPFQLVQMVATESLLALLFQEDQYTNTSGKASWMDIWTHAQLKEMKQTIHQRARVLCTDRSAEMISLIGVTGEETVSFKRVASAAAHRIFSLPAVRVFSQKTIVRADRVPKEAADLLRVSPECTADFPDYLLVLTKTGEIYLHSF